MAKRYLGLREVFSNSPPSPPKISPTTSILNQKNNMIRNLQSSLQTEKVQVSYLETELKEKEELINAKDDIIAKQKKEIKHLLSIKHSYEDIKKYEEIALLQKQEIDSLKKKQKENVNLTEALRNAERQISSLNDEIYELQNEITKKNEDLKEYKSICFKYEVEMKEKENIVENFAEQLAKIQQENTMKMHNLEFACRNYQEELLHLKEELTSTSCHEEPEVLSKVCTEVQLKEEIARLNEIIDLLKEENTKLSDEVNIVSKSEKLLKNSKAHLEIELETNRIKFQETLKELKTLQGILGITGEKIDKYISSSLITKESIQNVFQTIHENVAELDDKFNKISQIMKEAKQKEAAIVCLKEENDELKKNVDVLTKDIDISKQEGVEMASKINQVMEEAKQKEAAIVCLKEENDELKKNVDVLTKDIDISKQEGVEMASKINQVMEEAKQKEAAIVCLKEENDELKKNVAVLTKDIDISKQEGVEMASKINQVMEEAKQKEAAIVCLKEENDELKKNVDVLTKDIDISKQEGVEMASKINQVMEEAKQKEAAIVCLKEENDELKKNVDVLTKDIDISKQEGVEMASKINQVMEEAKQKEAAIVCLKEENDELKKNVDVLTKDIDISKQKGVEMASKIFTLINDNNKISNQLELKTKEIKNLEINHAELKEIIFQKEMEFEKIEEIQKRNMCKIENFERKVAMNGDIDSCIKTLDDFVCKLSLLQDDENNDFDKKMSDVSFEIGSLEKLTEEISDCNFPVDTCMKKCADDDTVQTKLQCRINKLYCLTKYIISKFITERTDLKLKLQANEWEYLNSINKTKQCFISQIETLEKDNDLLKEKNNENYKVIISLTDENKLLSAEKANNLQEISHIKDENIVFIEKVRTLDEDLINLKCDFENLLRSKCLLEDELKESNDSMLKKTEEVGKMMKNFAFNIGNIEMATNNSIQKLLEKINNAYCKMSILIDAVKKSKEMEQEMLNLKHEKENADKEIAILHKEIEIKENLLQNSFSQISVLTSDKEQLYDEFKVNSDKLKNYESRVTEMKEEIIKNADELKRHQEMKIALEDEIQSFKKQVSLQGNVNSYIKTIDDLLSKPKFSRADFEENTAELSSKMDTLLQMFNSDARISKSSENCLIVKDSNQLNENGEINVKLTLEESFKNICKLVKTIAAFSTEQAVLKEKLKHSENCLQNQQDIMAELGLLKKDKKRLEEMYERQEDDMMSLKEKYNLLLKDNECKTTEISEMKKANILLDEEKLMLNNKMVRMNEETELLKESKTTLEKKFHINVHMLNEQMKEIEELVCVTHLAEKKIEDLTTVSEGAREMINDVVDIMASDVETLHSRMNVITSAVKRSKEENKELISLKEENKTLKEEIDKLQKEVFNTESKLKNIASKISALTINKTIDEENPSQGKSIVYASNEKLKSAHFPNEEKTKIIEKLQMCLEKDVKILQQKIASQYDVDSCMKTLDEFFCTLTLIDDKKDSNVELKVKNYVVKINDYLNSTNSGENIVDEGLDCETEIGGVKSLGVESNSIKCETNENIKNNSIEFRLKNILHELCYLMKNTFSDFLIEQRKLKTKIEEQERESWKKMNEYKRTTLTEMELLQKEKDYLAEKTSQLERNVEHLTSENTFLINTRKENELKLQNEIDHLNEELDGAFEKYEKAMKIAVNKVHLEYGTLHQSSIKTVNEITKLKKEEEEKVENLKLQLEQLQSKYQLALVKIQELEEKRLLEDVNSDVSDNEKFYFTVKERMSHQLQTAPVKETQQFSVSHSYYSTPVKQETIKDKVLDRRIGSILCEDEETELMMQKDMSSINGIFNLDETEFGRLNELQRRNTLCLPHLRTSYPVETQMCKPINITEDEIKAENNFESSLNESFDESVSFKRNPRRNTIAFKNPQARGNENRKNFLTPSKKLNKKQPSRTLKTPNTLKRLFKSGLNSKYNINQLDGISQNISFNVGFSPKDSKLKRLSKLRNSTQISKASPKLTSAASQLKIFRKPLGQHNKRNPERF